MQDSEPPSPLPEEQPPKRSVTPEDDRKNARTIFVSNLPIEVAQKKSNVKQLRRHILSLVPTAKIQSTRFRSVPFNVPTAAQSEQPRAHTKARAQSWRNSQGDEQDQKKKYLTPSEKKRVAFIKADFHSSADSINAYIVFAHPPVRAPNLPPLQVLDPYQAAIEATEKCNGTTFMDRTIRVDLADKSMSDALGDPKLSIFVGNLDFATHEDDLRLFFEGVISAERGPVVPQADVDRPTTWVRRVRIVRDPATQLGKGFGYIQLADHQCIDELLSLEPGKLKFSKRKLRLERCKTLPATNSTTKTDAHTVIAPRGDPSLGAKLAHLPKDERKRIKSADAGRIARRLAKKAKRQKSRVQL